MIRAEGNGLSECCVCKTQGLFSLTWTSFLYRICSDNYIGLYCYEHAKELEEDN